MKRITNRQAALFAAGLLAAGTAASAATVAAQSADISGTVTFAEGKAVPEGRLKIFLEDPGAADKKALATETQLKSDGGAKTLAFVLTIPESAAASPTLQVVARLERADGWLLAQGNAKVRGDLPVEISLYTVMY
ncbi:hypothetical protein [Roseibium sp. M-1]